MNEPVESHVERVEKRGRAKIYEKAKINRKFIDKRY
jgi:hypothetical protein